MGLNRKSIVLATTVAERKVRLTSIIKKARSRRICKEMKPNITALAPALLIKTTYELARI